MAGGAGYHNRTKMSIRVTTTIMCLIVIIISRGANGQINTPCTNSIVSSFTPCFNFITSSTSNGTSSPPQDCCDSLKSIMTNMIDCACLIVTGNVPFSIPFVRTLVLSLPLQQCNSGVPFQCKGSGAPLPAPGPVALAPNYYSTPPAYSPQPHHNHHRHHPPAYAPHSSRASKNSDAQSPNVEPPVETPASPPFPPSTVAKQPKKTPTTTSSTTSSPLSPIFPNKSPAGTGATINPSKTSNNNKPNNSSHVSSSPTSHMLLFFVVFVMFIC